MGKYKKKGGKPNQNGNDNRRKPVKDDRGLIDTHAIRKSERFEGYYKEQKIVSEEEWEPMLNAFRASLPVTFRITGSRSSAQDLNDMIKSTYIPHLTNVTWEGEPVPAPTQLSWYPGGLAWQLKVQKTVIRKSPEFKKFQDFLVYETDVGNISRQEAVSMIPPLVLDVQPHHAVLDMCAAPGSKTAQLIDALHSDPSPPPSTSTHPSPPPPTTLTEPTGVVIANDSDFKRAYMLVHQSARLHSTALMVTNLDASLFPTIKLETPTKGGIQKIPLLFDRILADVPCSGDGTLRKNPQIWGSWQPAIGNGLHALQLRILLRGMSMLAKDGRIVYSTCSMNPVENEAVLAAALNTLPGQFRLIDVSSRLPGLIRRPGITNWRVATASRESVTYFDTYDEFEGIIANGPGTEKEKREKIIKVPKTLFPPENVGDLGLDRAMRIYPHLQDTGAFFVAILERVQLQAPAVLSLVVESRSEGPSNSSALKRSASVLSDSAVAPESKKPKPDSSAAVAENETDHSGEDDVLPASATLISPGNDEAKISSPPQSWKESPYTFMPPEHRHSKSLFSSLKIDPSSISTRIFVRTADLEQPRSVYICSPLVRSIMSSNDPSKIRLINCGVKAFTRQANEGGKLLKAAASAEGSSGEASITGTSITRTEITADAGKPDAIEEEGSEKDKDKDKEMVFRFVYEGVQAVIPFIDPSYILHAGLKELRRMLEVYYPSHKDFEGSEFGAQVEKSGDGARLITFEAGEYGGAILAKPITMPLWISAKSLSLMTDKQTKSALCLRLFGEDFTPFGIELKAKKRQTKALDAPIDGSSTVTVVPSNEELNMAVDEAEPVT